MGNPPPIPSLSRMVHTNSEFTSSQSPSYPEPRLQNTPSTQASSSSPSSAAKPIYNPTNRNNPERSYKGPDRNTLPHQRTPQEAERYFKSVGVVNEGGMFSARTTKFIGVGGWVLGGCMFCFPFFCVFCLCNFWFLPPGIKLWD